MLYSIQFLHQITTQLLAHNVSDGCIVSNFYIKSQHLESFATHDPSCIVSNFYIKSQRTQFDFIGFGVV